MPRSKRDAQLRLNVGMARVLLSKGYDARAGLEAFKAHLAIQNALENSAVEDRQEPPEISQQPTHLRHP